jgi:lipopolysaccharide biosynthesis protein
LADQFTTPAYLVERYSAAFRGGLELAQRRAEAVQKFWEAVPHLREPKDVVALQTSYLTRALDDYGAVIAAAMPRSEKVEFAPAATPAHEAALAA